MTDFPRARSSAEFCTAPRRLRTGLTAGDICGSGSRGRMSRRLAPGALRPHANDPARRHMTEWQVAISGHVTRNSCRRAVAAARRHVIGDGQ